MRFRSHVTRLTSLWWRIIVFSPAIVFRGVGRLNDSSLFEVDLNRWLVTSEFVVSSELHNRLELFSPVWSRLNACMCRSG